VNARDFLAVICAKCPSYEVPLPDCPLAEYRGSGRSDAPGELSDDQVDDLIRAHFLCVCRKEGCGT